MFIGNKRKIYEKVTYRSKQIISGNHNNQAGGDIHYNNFIGNLKRKPRNVKVQAIIDYTLYYYLLSFSIAGIIVFIGWLLLPVVDSAFIQKYYYTIIITAAVSSAFGAVASIYCLEKNLLKFSFGHIEYNDKMIIYKNNEEKFYEDIWDIEVHETRMGRGKIRYFGINKLNEPYSRTIVVMNYAKAKYIYDSFWNNEKIEEFKSKSSVN